MHKPLQTNKKQLDLKTTILSRDKNTVIQYVAFKLDISNTFGDFLPESKVNKVQQIKPKNEDVAFVGNGVNDAPWQLLVMQILHAMGGLGRDATLETADVPIQDDKPNKIPMTINIRK